MNTQKVKQQLWLCMIFLISFGLLLSSLPSNAMVISWDLQWEYSGAFPPEGPPPWLTAIIDDEIDPGNVTLTMISNLTGSEFVNLWFFNYDTDKFTLTPSDFVYQQSSTGPEPTIMIGNNSFHAAADGWFDISFDFQNPFSGERFESSEVVVFTISKPGLTANSFNSMSVFGENEIGLFTASHVGGIGPAGDNSGWITIVPEPSTIFFLFFGLIGFLGFKKKIRD
ncbi:MAG: PEP-CTERM sorting domain-containing protein [bacterium]